MCLFRSCFLLVTWQLRQRHNPPPSAAIINSVSPEGRVEGGGRECLLSIWPLNVGPSSAHGSIGTFIEAMGLPPVVI